MLNTSLPFVFLSLSHFLSLFYIHFSCSIFITCRPFTCSNFLSFIFFLSIKLSFSVSLSLSLSLSLFLLCPLGVRRNTLWVKFYAAKGYWTLSQWNEPIPLTPKQQLPNTSTIIGSFNSFFFSLSLSAIIFISLSICDSNLWTKSVLLQTFRSFWAF